MFILFLLILFFLPFQINAVGEFKIGQNISYSVNTLGTANVSHEVNLTNNYSQIYAKEYQINLSGHTLQNITGSDSYGNVIDQIKSSPDYTNILLKFSIPVVGKDQTHKFTLNYSIQNFAKKKGNTWEIQFPLFEDKNDSQNIQINLEIPSIFGEMSFSSIPSTATHNLGNKTQIIFTPKTNNKIFLVFGNHQLFDFKLNYFIKNDQNTKIITEIPIPPDTNYQKIILDKINPPPENIVTDIDGNWLAQFTLLPQQTIDITVSGQAKIHPPKPNPIEIPENIYTSVQKYWPTTDPQILSINQNLSDVKSIYRYVVNTLNYNYDQIDSAKRQGAINAVNFPNNALCTEFTDLFVTLLRSKQIPAREIEGFAYSNNSKIKPINTNSDVLHAWPEYYNTSLKKWIQVDPTWEKTTNGIDFFTDLDLNHLTFVIHGKSSELPFPPGSYQTTPRTKSVFVDFATSEINPNITTPKVTIQNKKVIINNQNPISLNNFNLLSSDGTLKYSTKILLPFSTISFDLPPINPLKMLLPNAKNFHLTLTYDESSSPLEINIINKIHFLYFSIFVGISIFILCIGGIIITTTNRKK